MKKINTPKKQLPNASTAATDPTGGIDFLHLPEAKTLQTLTFCLLETDQQQIIPFLPKILTLDQAVPAGSGSLKEIAQQLETRVLATTEVLASGKFMREDDWFAGRHLEAIQNQASLEDAFQGMIQLMSLIMHNLPDCRLQLGNLKTEASIQRRSLRTHGRKGVSDQIRCRVIAPDIQKLLEARSKTLNQLGQPDRFPQIKSQATAFQIVRYRNFFAGKGILYGDGHFRAYNLVIALDQNHCFELQLVTENTWLVGLLEHPFLVSQSVPFPDEVTCHWLLDLTWKKNIVDYRKYLSS